MVVYAVRLEVKLTLFSIQVSNLQEDGAHLEVCVLRWTNHFRNKSGFLQRPIRRRHLQQHLPALPTRHFTLPQEETLVSFTTRFSTNFEDGVDQLLGATFDAATAAVARRLDDVIGIRIRGVDDDLFGGRKTEFFETFVVDAEKNVT